MLSVHGSSVLTVSVTPSSEQTIQIKHSLMAPVGTEFQTVRELVFVDHFPYSCDPNNL